MEAEKIIITENNIRRLKEYVADMRELNRFIKGNFGKNTRENPEIFSISPIVRDIHRELDVLEKKIAEYEKRNHSVLKDGGYYKVMNSLNNNKTEFYHILKKHNDGRHVNTEKIEVCLYSNSFIIDGRLKKEHNEIVKWSSTELIDAYYEGRLQEIPEDEWEKLTENYEKNREFLTGYIKVNED